MVLTQTLEVLCDKIPHVVFATNLNYVGEEVVKILRKLDFGYFQHYFDSLKLHGDSDCIVSS